MPLGKAVIGQSGGPTAVINRSLVGFIKEATKPDFDEILGAKHGLEGMLNEDFVDLSNLSEAQLYGIGKTPAAALGSVRKKPTDSDIEKLVSIFEEQNIRNFFYIGGNDSAETANLVSEGAKSIGYEPKIMRKILVLRKMDIDERLEQEALLDTYRNALGIY